MSAFTEETCLHAVSTNFCKCIPTTANQTFLFVPDGIKLARACSSDVYSFLRTKAEIMIMKVYAIHVNCVRHISIRPLFCRVAFAIITRVRKLCIPGALSPPPPLRLGRG